MGVGAIRDEEKRGQGEEEAEDRDKDEREEVRHIRTVNVVVEVRWNTFLDIVPPIGNCHTDAVDDVTSYGKDDIHKCELGGECDERLS